jgi:hypothetical protein
VTYQTLPRRPHCLRHQIARGWPFPGQKLYLDQNLPAAVSVPARVRGDEEGLALRRLGVAVVGALGTPTEQTAQPRFILPFLRRKLLRV